MADSKKKLVESGLRQPKPKKKLGLTVPHPLQMPHDVLFHQPEPTASSNLQLVQPDDRQPESTGNDNQPVAHNNQTAISTSSGQQPVAIKHQSPESTGNDNQPVAHNDQQPEPTSQYSQPVAQQHQSPEPASQSMQPVAQRPVTKADLSVNSDRSNIATSQASRPVIQASEYHPPKEEYFLTPNSVSDEVQQVLTDEQFSVYFRLFRLSHGFKQTTCFVGYNALARALGWKVWKVKKVMPEVLASGYVRIVESYNGQGLKGTVYEVLTSRYSQPAEDNDQQPKRTGRTDRPNKHDDDHVKQNPHQSAVMKIYRELTGNEFTKADEQQYQKLTGLTAEEIEFHMRAIHGRAASRIGSLAYFVKGIEQASHQGGQQPSPTTLETRYRQIAREIAAAWVGGNQMPSEWIDRLKWRCAQEGLAWDNDIANKVLGF